VATPRAPGAPQAAPAPAWRNAVPGEVSRVVGLALGRVLQLLELQADGVAPLRLSLLAHDPCRRLQHGRTATTTAGWDAPNSRGSAQESVSSSAKSGRRTTTRTFPSSSHTVCGPRGREATARVIAARCPSACTAVVGSLTPGESALAAMSTICRKPKATSYWGVRSWLSVTAWSRAWSRSSTRNDACSCRCHARPMGSPSTTWSPTPTSSCSRSPPRSAASPSVPASTAVTQPLWLAASGRGPRSAPAQSWGGPRRAGTGGPALCPSARARPASACRRA
jgi:hypothetical protein